MTTIAQHFDWMIQDAERLKQAKEHHSQSCPIAHANLSVHAFSSLTAAVNEDSDSEIDECDFHPAGRDADNEGDAIHDTRKNPYAQQPGPLQLQAQHLTDCLFQLMNNEPDDKLKYR
ncbi:hypothetical protein PPACK8108_LOCUS24625 [Phakopsora pachyrhizi]|uniref:Uncharacterized protein n=1 Tax=Phakopsora pachyrhizi TaxID=170000 RepID=A0AAV0BQ94_PHAPC|nr:hypothetical protein PPACK8108_LOCUS24625 [Phakopsora pachyrhizi]